MNKEENLLKLFFNESSRHWHFEELVKESGISRDKANKWLKKLLKESIIKKIKEVKKMPYYIADFKSASYKNRKRLYALEQFYKTGFLNHLMELDAKAVIIFGSFSRADWHTNSDIDLLILGNAKNFQQARYEREFGREIQAFIYKDKKSIQRRLLKSISEGYIVKGNLNA